MPGTSSTRVKPTPSSISGGSGDHIQRAEMLPRGRRSQYGFKHHRAALRHRGWKHRSCPTSNAKRFSQRDTGIGDTVTVATAWAWHPPGRAKPPLLRTQFYKSQALTLQTSCPEGAGPPRAKPGPSHRHSRARSGHEPAKPASPNAGELGDGAFNPSISSQHHHHLPFPAETPARALRTSHTPPAPLTGMGGKIEIPLAKQVPVLSTLFFSSEDTKEFKHRA